MNPLSWTTMLLAVVVAGPASADGIPLWTNVRTAIPDADWRHLAARYSLAFTLFSPRAGGKDLSAENERVKWIKSLNPRLKVLVYGSAINAANFRLPAWRRPQEHPEWFLKDEAGEWVADWEYGGALHLDPATKGWQQYVADALKDYIDRYGYDGVFLDLVTATTHYVNFKKPKRTVNANGAVYTDSGWKDANLELLRTVRSAIGGKLLIINGCRRGTGYFQDGYGDFLDVADGMCNEGFTGWAQKPPGFGSEADWKADVEALADCAKRGKAVLAVANVKKRESTEPAEQHEALYRYITASFLLGMGQRHYLMFYAKVPGQPEDYRPGEEVLPALCNVLPGKPTGAYYQADGVYQRDFEQGKVLVNPTGRAATIALEGAWQTDKGEPVRSPLQVTEHSGVILLRDTR